MLLCFSSSETRPVFLGYNRSDHLMEHSPSSLRKKAAIGGPGWESCLRSGSRKNVALKGDIQRLGLLGNPEGSSSSSLAVSIPVPERLVYEY